MNLSKKIGRQIQAARNAKGLSLRQLADKTGIHEATILKLEQGKGNPTLKTLNKLSAVLEVSFTIGGPAPSFERDERTRMALTVIYENLGILEKVLWD